MKNLAALFTIAKTTGTTRVLHQQRVGVRRCGECTHTNITQLLKKKRIGAICSNMDELEKNILLSEVSHTEKDKYSIHMWHLKNNNTSESI